MVSEVNYISVLNGLYQHDRMETFELLSVIGQDAKDIWQNHLWKDEENRYKVAPLLQMYDNYCNPRIISPYKRHTFHWQKQQAGEDVRSWYNDLRRLRSNCAFAAMTTDKMYRDHLVSNVLNERVRDKLLEQCDLTLEKTLDIIRSSEIKAEQAKAWNSIGDMDMLAMRKGTRTRQWGKHGNEAERRPREATQV